MSNILLSSSLQIFSASYYQFICLQTFPGCIQDKIYLFAKIQVSTDEEYDYNKQYTFRHYLLIYRDEQLSHARHTGLFYAIRS